MNAWTQIYLVIATVAQTAILLWGIKKVSSVLDTPANGVGGATFARSMLSEKNPAPPNQNLNNPPQPGSGDASFSRVAGSIGTIVLAAFFGGASYWALYALFNGNDLSKLQQIGPFVLAGSALFAPYAFNQLRAIFK